MTVRVNVTCICQSKMYLRRFWKIFIWEGRGKKRTEVRIWKGIPGLEKRLTRGERRMRGDSGGYMYAWAVTFALTTQ